ncbi:MAG TPA: VWA domain-containing protein [Pyrinomonadaceae bacterium]|jgi:VWFA-related protein
MRLTDTIFQRYLCAALCCASIFVSVAHGQQGAGTPPASQTPPDVSDDDVVRISTELVQTDVMVFDKQGRFIDNLKPEQFELRVDGKPQSISFFERIVAGSTNEESQLAAARGGGGARSAGATVVPLDRGRTIFFFVDDLHLSADSVMRTRKSLLSFIDKEVKQNDQVAITSASGQIGFLQQLTDNKAVLRKAVERISYRAFNLRDAENPPMTILQALEIEQNNQNVLAYFVDIYLRENPGMRADMAENMIRGRARSLLQQSDAVNNNVLLTLSSLMRSAAQLPGRKLVFFLSEGFVMNIRDSDVLDKMRRATDAAARSGTVVYTMSPAGLETGVDASVSQGFDVYGRLPTTSAEIRTKQDPLRMIAENTGGRALLNTNALDASIERSLQETSVYYLLAWRPDAEQQKPGKFRRIEARVVGRPELSVRVRNGFFATDPETTTPKRAKTTSTSQPAAATPETELRKAITDVFPKRALPTSVFAYYNEMPDSGPVLTIVMAVSPEAVTLETKDGKQTGTVDVAGLVYNDEGKSGASFKDRLQLNVAPENLPAFMNNSLFYNYQVRIKPGLYQVRVGARDSKTGRTGSATQWIEIPDLAKGRLAMSSLVIGGHPTNAQEAASEANPVSISVERRFKRNEQLRFITYIYNAQRAASGAPDVALQVQIFRDDQPVVTTALSKVKTEGLPDMSRLPYAAEVRLDKLPVGQYVLSVTAIDRIAKTSTSQQLGFMIE